MKTLEFQSDENFELIILYSLLTKTRVCVDVSSHMAAKVGFIKAIRAVVPGLEYKATDSSLEFTPGPLIGGKAKAEVKRIGNFVRYLSILAPFMKEAVCLELRGSTNDSDSLDMLCSALPKVFGLFNVPGFGLNVARRGFQPLGQGKAYFRVDTVRTLSSIDVREEEAFESIKGLVVSARLGADVTTRMINVIKAEMKDVAETKVFCVVGNKNDSGPSPGYECSVYCESSVGIFYNTLNNGMNPEEMAKECCAEFLKNLDAGGVIDQKLHPIVLTFMALATGVSHLRIGVVDERVKGILDLLKRFFNIEYSLHSSNDGWICTVVGCGYKNIAKPV